MKMTLLDWNYAITAEGILILCFALVMKNISLCIFGATFAMLGQSQVIIFTLKEAKK
jgi:hypothetical protein